MFIFDFWYIIILMSQYYNPRRTRNLFDPQSPEPFKVSRSRIDLFLNCPRCFYIDRKLGVDRPPGFPFSLNSAVDTLLKKEFDMHRARGSRHPLMEHYGLDAVPLAHERMDEWRDSLRRGIQYHHRGTNLIITGGVDDIWVKPNKDLIIVDYKATSKSGEVSLDADWQIGYKRQMEIYQWLFRQNGFQVSDTGYFVYCNGDADAQAFDAKLEFDIKLIPYTGKTDWVEPALADLHKCLMAREIPKPGRECDYCAYRAAADDVEKKTQQRATASLF